MKALVTGASGFIGRRLVMELARRGHETACLVRPTSKTAPLRDLPVEFVLGDLGDAASLVRAVKGRDHIFHLAGVIQAVGGPAFETANVMGTRNLVDACLQAAPGVKRFTVKVPFAVQMLAARLAETAARLTRRPPLLTREIVRAARDHFWIYDGSKIERELGFRPRYGMRESVRRAVDAVRAGGSGGAGQGPGA